MKIFFITTSLMIDAIVKNKHYPKDCSFKQIMIDLKSFGFSELFGIDRFNESFFDTVANSKYIQTKWAKENNIKYSANSWEGEILAAQIEKFQPDVIYTGNYNFFTKELKKYLPKVKLYALWNASPMKEGVNLSYFDVGISFNKIYQYNLEKKGIKNIEYNSFYIDPNIKTKLNGVDLVKDIDISFTGRYSPMFKARGQFLYDIYNQFNREYNIQYFLLTGRRFRGLLPVLPWRLLQAYNRPIFLEDMFKVFNRSKIVLNTHSNITGLEKGNMRVYEALGSGSFMLTDDGIYPKNLVAGEDFITYKNKKDMMDKIDFFLKHDREREEIALNGHKKISQYYSTEIGSKSLEAVFEKYL